MIEYAGTWHQTTAIAARTWAAHVLPDTGVIEASEVPAEAARELEAFTWGEVQRAELEGVPDGLSEDEWREACRKALEARIVESR